MLWARATLAPPPSPDFDKMVKRGEKMTERKGVDFFGGGGGTYGVLA